MQKLTTLPVATICLAIAFLIVVGVGGVLVITNSENLSFEDYVKSVGVVAVALGLLGIGRGRDAESKP